MDDRPAASQPMTRSKTKKTLLGKDYLEEPDFRNGLLPTKKDIIQNMMYLTRPARPGKRQVSKEEASGILAEVLLEHWLFCNLYTVTTKRIKLHILNLYAEFMYLNKMLGQRTGDSYKIKAKAFNDNCDKLFDVFCDDSDTRRKLEENFGVKMKAEEWQFLEDQRGPRKMFCEDFVDKKWEKTMLRRRRDIDALESLRQSSAPEVDQSEAAAMEIGSSESETGESDVSQELYYIEGRNTNDSNDSDDLEKDSKRRCLSMTKTSGFKEIHKHIRTSDRNVRPEFYETVDKLKSAYHMTEPQAEAAVVEVGNKMFGRDFKYHKEHAKIDLDTLPAPSCVRLAAKSIEAQALDRIVNEIMSAKEKGKVITYSDDGSKKQGVGSFMVQGVTIDGKYRALPTLPISTESKNNLADLQVAVINIMEAASGIPAKDIYERIDFVITDQTAHNFGVEEKVTEKLDADSTPEHLFCNVHPSLMFNRVLTKHWTSIEVTIGRDKIFSNFLVNSNNTSDGVIVQGLDCLTRLINHDFDHKPWNKAAEFDMHIAPKKNKSFSLKDERFDRLTLCCAVGVHHYDDANEFLQKYEHVTNQLACIVRNFLDIEILKVMFCVGALVGLHLVGPFLSLTTSKATTYSTLIPAFKQLHVDLQTTNPALLLDISTPAFKFISRERFLSTRYDNDICASLSDTIEKYRPHIIGVLGPLLPALAKGFENQKGKLFGFGEEGRGDSPHQLESMDQEKLEQAPIHNLDAERSVGFVNYELSRRGSGQLEAASSAQVKAKSYDLLESQPSGSFKDYSPRIRSKIKELKLDWVESQQILKEKGMSEKELSNIAVDRRRMKDLQKLKAMGGPFTSATEVDRYVADGNAEEKVERLYLEVRYARDTSLTIPKASDIFRLMKDHKKLPAMTYVKNLKVFLDNVTTKSAVTLDDLTNAVSKMATTD